jgi:hypothetical protein
MFLIEATQRSLKVYSTKRIDIEQYLLIVRECGMIRSITNQK